MASGEGPRRHLPPWMVRVRTTDRVSNSGSEVKCKKNGLKVLPREVCHPSSVGENERQPVEVAIFQSESTETDSVSLKKCKSTRGRKKLAKRAEDSDNNMHEGDVEKENHAPRRKRSAKVPMESSSNATGGDVEKENRAPRRRRSAKVSMESSSNAAEGYVEKENHAPSRRKRKGKVSVETSSDAIEESTHDEDKLTVDDLISIAKEYINTEGGYQRQRLSSMERESEIPLPPPFFPKDKPVHENPNPSSNGVSDITTSEASSSGLVKCMPIESGIVSSSEPEDFALDIIDLFLGGMLKRSKTVKQNPEPVTESLRLDYAPSNPTRDGPVRAADPVHKKKGSLKDKVAMLLS